MRKFNTRKQSFFEFQLEGSDKVYKIPTAASLPAKVLQNLIMEDREGRGFEAQLAMLHTYMGDVADELTVETLSEILQEWGKASNNEGVSVGE